MVCHGLESYRKIDECCELLRSSDHTTPLHIMRAAVAAAAAALRPAAGVGEMSKRAAFRALSPAQRWLDRIAELDVGRVRRPKLPKMRNRVGEDGEPLEGWAGEASRGPRVRAEHPAGPLFTKLKLLCKASTPEELPAEGPPEIAFCGRCVHTYTHGSITHPARSTTLHLPLSLSLCPITHCARCACALTRRPHVCLYARDIFNGVSRKFIANQRE
jgi:hypothetical protein